MPRPLRSELFLPHEVSICHVVQRCVRRMYLAGLDDETGKDFTYRREWIRQRLEKLASVFAIDVLTYAIPFQSFARRDSESSRCCENVVG